MALAGSAVQEPENFNSTISPFSIALDGTVGHLGIFNGAAEVAWFQVSAGLSSLLLKNSSNDTAEIEILHSNGLMNFYYNSSVAATFGISTTGFYHLKPVVYYNGVSTVGAGVPPIYAAGAQTLYTNAAPTTVSYTPPATAGVYRISAYLNILTGGTQTFKIKITYKDPGGNAVTDIPDFEQQNSVTLLAGSPGANATGRFWFVAVIAIDNSATAITVADNAGTYTAGTYYWTPVLEQLA